MKRADIFAGLLVRIPAVIAKTLQKRAVKN